MQTVHSTLEPVTLGRLLDVGRSLVSELDLEVVLGRVLEAARDLTGASYAALGILDEGREELERFLTVGIDADRRAVIGDLPRGHGVLGELIRHPHPLRLARVSDHPRSYGFPQGHPPMTTFLGVPILIRGEAYGNLYLTDKRSGEFDERDEEATVVLAEWAAIAIENARLYERTESRREELQRAGGQRNRRGRRRRARARARPRADCETWPLACRGPVGRNHAQGRKGLGRRGKRG